MDEYIHINTEIAGRKINREPPKIKVNKKRDGKNRSVYNGQSLSSKDIMPLRGKSLLGVDGKEKSDKKG